jgi:hypothetical protein
MTVQVAASEHALIALARALIVPDSGEPAVMLAAAHPMARTISADCADLLEEALRKLWPALWRRGHDRVWERHPATALVHTPATLQLLRWLVATPLALADHEPLAASPLAIGDQVMVYLALDAAGDSAIRATIARQPLVRAAPLAWLGFAHVMTGEPPDFAGLADGAGALVVESLAWELAARWRAIELEKRAISNVAASIALGAAQDATLHGFMSACEKRRDLAGWVIDAAAPHLERGLSPAPLALDPDAPLSERSAARLASGSLLRAVVRWREWDDQHRAVRFIDDDYATAQRLLSRFERIGRAGADRAATWLAELAALVPTTGGASASI